MLCFPNCKLNIGLYVTGKRSDGYHNIETIFYPVALNDVLEVTPATNVNDCANSEDRLHITGLPVAGNATDNLVLKSYGMVREKFPEKVPSLDIFLHKVIPSGAGLGGGSADGAFMLKLLNTYCKLKLSKNDLAQMALALGSDCPFFIHNCPMFASGRGEQFTHVSIDLSAYSIQLVYPHIHVSTGAAFGLLNPEPAPFDLRKIAQLPVPEWRYFIKNDFEEQVFQQHPEIAQIKEQLYAGGAIYASMSGSGSAVFGIMPKDTKSEIQVAVVTNEWLLDGNVVK